MTIDLYQTFLKPFAKFADFSESSVQHSLIRQKHFWKNQNPRLTRNNFSERVNVHGDTKSTTINQLHFCNVLL